MPFHTLHMVACDWDKRVNATRGVQAARKALGNDDLGATLQRSYEAVSLAHAHPEKPVLIGRHTELDKIHTAAKALETVSEGACRAAIDLTPEQSFAVDQAQPKPSELSADPEPQSGVFEKEFDSATWATAMVLMALQGGNPGAALGAANTLMRTSGDPDFYDEVGNAIVHAFPPA